MSLRATQPTHAVLHTSRFDTSWHEEGGDDHAPPGKEFADELLAAIRRGTVLVPLAEEVAADDWEHSNWCIWARWKRHIYRIDIECLAYGAETEGKWLVSITRARLGLLPRLKAAMTMRYAGLREPASEVLEYLGEVLASTAQPTSIEWIADTRPLFT